MQYNHRDLVKQDLDLFLNTHKFDTVLEIGAGENNNPNAIAFQNYFEEKGMKYTGIDREARGEKVIKCDAHELCFPDNHFDFIFSCHTFEHLENPLKALKEMKRVLKTGGFIFLATPNHCEHQIMNADNDHIFVLTPFQFMRLFEYIKMPSLSYIQMLYNGNVIPKEQDYTTFSVATKRDI